VGQMAAGWVGFSSDENEQERKGVGQVEGESMTSVMSSISVIMDLKFSRVIWESDGSRAKSTDGE
jgi:hypothetical protein